MLYILCEDEGSGLTFWMTVNKVLLHNRARVVTAKGKDNITAKFVTRKKDAKGNEISGVARGVQRDIFLTADDTLLIAFDNIGGTTTSKVIGAANREREHIGFRLIYTTYYCIEEVFISFPDLFEYCEFDGAVEYLHKQIDTAELRSKLTFLRDCILNRKDLAKEVSQSILFQGSNISKIGREQFSSNFLTRITRQAVGYFLVDKSKLGECWQYSCDEAPSVVNAECILNGKKFSNYACNICKLKSTIPDISDRLINLSETSVLKPTHVSGVALLQLNEFA